MIQFWKHIAKMYLFYSTDIVTGSFSEIEIFKKFV